MEISPTAEPQPSPSTLRYLDLASPAPFVLSGLMLAGLFILACFAFIELLK